MLYLLILRAQPTTPIYTLSLHDALPIWPDSRRTRVASLPLSPGVEEPSPAVAVRYGLQPAAVGPHDAAVVQDEAVRSEEHTSELQSHVNLVCRLLLEKKKKITLAPSVRP